MKKLLLIGAVTLFISSSYSPSFTAKNLLTINHSGGEHAYLETKTTEQLCDETKAGLKTFNNKNQFDLQRKVHNEQTGKKVLERVQITGAEKFGLKNFHRLEGEILYKPNIRLKVDKQLVDDKAGKFIAVTVDKKLSTGKIPVYFKNVKKSTTYFYYQLRDGLRSFNEKNPFDLKYEPSIFYSGNDIFTILKHEAQHKFGVKDFFRITGKNIGTTTKKLKDYPDQGPIFHLTLSAVVDDVINTGPVVVNFKNVRDKSHLGYEVKKIITSFNHPMLPFDLQNRVTLENTGGDVLAIVKKYVQEKIDQIDYETLTGTIVDPLTKKLKTDFSIKENNAYFDLTVTVDNDNTLKYQTFLYFKNIAKS